jgi:hypothetical protein
MQEKYAKDGLVVMTVNIDDTDDQRAGAIRFLKAKKPGVVNWMIAPDEKQADWEGKLKLEQFPSTLLYDREGKLAAHPQGDEAEGQKIEEAVKEQLSKK